VTRRRRDVSVFGLSFLDAMTCGFGAVVLFFMVINAAVGRRSGRLTADLKGEVDRLEVEVLDGVKRLVELRNSAREIDLQQVTAQGLSRRVLERIEEIREELANADESSLARRESVEKLESDLRSLEEDVKRLQAMAPSDETPGERVRAFTGDGDRQYLTGLRVGGSRILILVDASASMLDDTLVNIIRRRNLPEASRRQAEKWKQAVATVDWLTTQLPRQARFQIVAFNTVAAAVVEGSEGTWLDAGDRAALEDAVSGVRVLAPEGGTSLHNAFAVASSLNPRPDNLVLITDGLPTEGATPSRRRKVSGEQRLSLFQNALRALPRGIPVNVILFPIEGDPLASSSFWKLALATGGAFLTPSRDWP
jgi:hypothetical protein